MGNEYVGAAKTHKVFNLKTEEIKKITKDEYVSTDWVLLKHRPPKPKTCRVRSIYKLGFYAIPQNQNLELHETKGTNGNKVINLITNEQKTIYNNEIVNNNWVLFKNKGKYL